MAQFTMTIPDGIVPTLLDAFEWNYPIPLDDQEPPQPLYTQVEWSKLKLRDYVREIYKAYKAVTDAESARQAAITQADSDTIGVDVQ